jgi:hypothetical protein
MKYRIWDTINKEYIKDYVIHNDEIVKLNKITKCLGHLQYMDEFNHIRITKEEFMNRASNSTLKTVLNVTRRNAKKLLNKI